MEAMEPRAARLRLRRGRQRGHDAGQPRGVPALADRAADAARRLRARPAGRRCSAPTMPAPVLLAPIGVQKIVHADGELASARAAARLGLPFVASTASAYSLEEVAEAGGDGPRWFQLYWPKRRRDRREHGRPRRGRRLRGDRRHRRHLHPGLEAARPPAGLAAVPRGHRDRQLLRGPGLPRRRSSSPPEEDVGAADRPLPQRLREPAPHLGRPRLAARADLAADPAQGDPPPRRRPRGASSAASTGSIVSNHGGRQVDGAIAALDALPAIVEAVGERDRGAVRQRHPRRRRRPQGARAGRRRRPPRPPLPLGAGARRPGRASRRC